MLPFIANAVYKSSLNTPKNSSDRCHRGVSCPHISILASSQTEIILQGKDRYMNLPTPLHYKRRNRRIIFYFLKFLELQLLECKVTVE